MAQISGAVKEFLDQRAKKARVDTIDPGADLFAEGILDSFALVELVGLLEQEYGITVPDGDVTAPTFRSLAQIEQYVDKRRG